MIGCICGGFEVALFFLLSGSIGWVFKKAKKCCCKCHEEHEKEKSYEDSKEG